MGEPNKLDIEKVTIPDVNPPEGEELTEKDQERVAGAGQIYGGSPGDYF
jgi:hypothetical protein